MKRLLLLSLTMLASCGAPLEVACLNSGSVSCELPCVTACAVEPDGTVSYVGAGGECPPRCHDNNFRRTPRDAGR